MKVNLNSNVTILNIKHVLKYCPIIKQVPSQTHQHIKSCLQDVPIHLLVKVITCDAEIYHSLAVCKVFMLKYALVQNVQAPFPIAFDVKY